MHEAPLVCPAAYIQVMQSTYRDAINNAILLYIYTGNVKLQCSYVQ